MSMASSPNTRILFVFVIFVLLFTITQSVTLHSENFDPQVSRVVTVSKNGSGDYTKIRDAVAAAPINSNGANGYFVIYVAAGVYEENVFVHRTRKFLMIIGEGLNRTVITGNHSPRTGWSALPAATLAVDATNFVAVNITIRNTAGPTHHWALAVHVSADMAAFYRCIFEGYQNTLFARSGNQFYRECDIYGTMDFIWGDAAVVFQNCGIYPRLPLGTQSNTITAQSRINMTQNTGFSFHNCEIKTAGLMDTADFRVFRTYLGSTRSAFARTVYMRTFMDDLIDPAGWLNSSISSLATTNTVYFAEFENYGPGSNLTGRVTWPGFHVINVTEAAQFTVWNFIHGEKWLPRTGVPYTGGL